MSDPKQTRRELATLRRHRKELLKLAETLLGVAEAGGAVDREAARDMSNASYRLKAIKDEIRAQKALKQ